MNCTRCTIVTVEHCVLTQDFYKLLSQARWGLSEEARCGWLLLACMDVCRACNAHVEQTRHRANKLPGVDEVCLAGALGPVRPEVADAPLFAHAQVKRLNAYLGDVCLLALSAVKSLGVTLGKLDFTVAEVMAGVAVRSVSEKARNVLFSIHPSDDAMVVPASTPFSSTVFAAPVTSGSSNTALSAPNTGNAGAVSPRDATGINLLPAPSHPVTAVSKHIIFSYLLRCLTGRCAYPAFVQANLNYPASRSFLLYLQHLLSTCFTPNQSFSAESSTDRFGDLVLDVCAAVSFCYSQAQRPRLVNRVRTVEAFIQYR